MYAYTCRARSIHMLSGYIHTYIYIYVYTYTHVHVERGLYTHSRQTWAYVLIELLVSAFQQETTLALEAFTAASPRKIARALDTALRDADNRGLCADDFEKFLPDSYPTWVLRGKDIKNWGHRVSYVDGLGRKWSAFLAL